MTAAELMARLNADPNFVQRRALEEQRLRRLEDEYRLAEVPLLDELNAAGCVVGSAWDLVNASEPYPVALPILLAHLARPYPPAVREGIARALAVPATKALGWSVIRDAFIAEPHGRVKDGLAAALAAAADDDVIDDVIDLACSREHGSSRLLLLRPLRRSRSARAHQALNDLARDPELKLEVEALLRT